MKFTLAGNSSIGSCPDGRDIGSYSADGWEPPHVHIVKDGKEAKIWLRDLNVAINLGYNSRELNEILRATRDHRQAFMEAWNDYFGA